MVEQGRGTRTHRTGGNLATWLTPSVTAGFATIVGIGCIAIEEGHCARRGGDLACDGRKCVMSFEAEIERIDGCTDEVPARGGFVHVKYGLPDDFDTFQRQLQTVADRRSPPLACSMDEVVELRPAFEVLHAEVIEPLDGHSRARRGSIDLGKIDDFTEAVDAWMAVSCKERPGGETTESGTDTGTSSDDAGSTPDSPSDCDDCPATAPFCDAATHECVGCDEQPDPDGACAELDSDRPLCVGGACVACTAASTTVCDDTNRVCDEETHECMDCTAHEQCATGACELVKGTCFPEGTLQLTADAARNVTVVVTEDVADGEFAVIRVHATEMAHGSVVIDGGKTIALLAASGDPRITGSEGGDPEVLRVEGAETVVYLDGLRLSGHQDGIGVRVTQGLAWLDRTRVVFNARGGIVAEDGAVLHMRNSTVGGNGSGDPGQSGLAVHAATAHVLYTTLARNDADSADSIHCVSGMVVTMRNSIAVGRDVLSIDCNGIEVTSSALDEDIGDEQDANENVGELVTGWFIDSTGGDFRLSDMGGAIFTDIARWRDGDPSEDIDGDARPDITGTPDYAGADIP
jgi:hypothetical protein